MQGSSKRDKKKEVRTLEIKWHIPHWSVRPEDLAWIWLRISRCDNPESILLHPTITKSSPQQKQLDNCQCEATINNESSSCFLIDMNNFLALCSIGNGDKLESSPCMAQISKGQLMTCVDKCPFNGIDEDRIAPAASRPWKTAREANPRDAIGTLERGQLILISSNKRAICTF